MVGRRFGGNLLVRPFQTNSRVVARVIPHHFGRNDLEDAESNDCSEFNDGENHTRPKDLNAIRMVLGSVLILRLNPLL
jgi:hypothetical protein